MSNNREDRIYHSRPGTVSLPLGGADRTLRFRTSELAELEVRRGGLGIMKQLDEDHIGLSWLRDAIKVGVSHEFHGKGKKDLTDKAVERWIDNCEEDGIEFQDLLTAVMKAVVGGLPGGARYVALMDEEDGEGSDSPPEEAA